MTGFLVVSFGALVDLFSVGFEAVCCSVFAGFSVEERGSLVVMLTDFSVEVDVVDFCVELIAVAAVVVLLEARTAVETVAKSTAKLKACNFILLMHFSLK